jgi:hypothetical protein
MSFYRSSFFCGNQRAIFYGYGCFAGRKILRRDLPVCHPVYHPVREKAREACAYVLVGEKGCVVPLSCTITNNLIFIFQYNICLRRDKNETNIEREADAFDCCKAARRKRGCHRKTVGNQ